MKTYLIGTAMVITGAVGFDAIKCVDVNSAWMALPIAVMLIGAFIKFRELFRFKRDLDAQSRRVFR